MTANAVYVFDAYGTLFDVHAAASAERAAIGPAFERLSQAWRTKHLEYTWIHAQTGRPIAFWTLAQRSLDYAAATVGGIAPDVRTRLLASYRRMAAYPDVSAVLSTLKARGARLAILSNGDQDMVDEAVAAAGLGDTFDAVLSVQAAGVFKPAPAVYRLVTDRFACKPERVTFLSSNRWDVAGAQVFGFATVWVNRAGAPDEYPDMPAGRIVQDLQPLIAA